MADHIQDGIFREIDEELRQEHYAKLWKKYGNYIVAAALVLIVAVAGYQVWRNYDIKNRGAQGERFAQAAGLAEANRLDEAVEAFSRLSNEAGGGYALLARFQAAALLGRSGDRDGAVLAYREVAEDDGINAIYRDLAVVLGVLHELNGGDSHNLILRLAPLTADDNPWRHSAREITAVLYLRSGERAKARQLLDGLGNDAAAPQGIRERAAEMLAVLGK